MSQPLKNWAIIHNTTKPDALPVALELKKIIEGLGGTAQVFERAPNFDDFDAAATIGGDGTLLWCVESAMNAHIPLVGVHMGTLGYLAIVDKEEIAESFRRIFNNEFAILRRSVLKCTLANGSSHYALNDIVIKSAEYRLADLTLHVDEKLISAYSCDGLIISTPTGTTAYNLSSGGPILHLDSDSLVVTPICSHTLSQRSVVISGRSHIQISFNHQKSKIRVNCDGRSISECDQCLPLKVRESSHRLITLEDPRKPQFDVLRSKLGWM